MTALTERERAIAQLVALGLTNEQIGLHLNYSGGTIKNAVTDMLLKTGQPNRIALAVWFTRQQVASAGGQT